MEESGTLHTPAALCQVKDPCTFLIGGWEGPLASPNILVKMKISCLYQDSKPRQSSPSLVTILTMLLRLDLSVVH